MWQIFHIFTKGKTRNETIYLLAAEISNPTQSNPIHPLIAFAVTSVSDGIVIIIIIIIIQPACFGAGCYIEMATSYH